MHLHAIFQVDLNRCWMCLLLFVLLRLLLLQLQLFSWNAAIFSYLLALLYRYLFVAVIITMLQFFLLLLLFTSFIGKFTSFDFGAHQIQPLDFVFSFILTVVDSQTYCRTPFYPNSVYLVSIWFNINNSPHTLKKDGKKLQ